MTDDEQFPVPVPAPPTADPTQALPVAEPTRALPVTAPPVPPNPYAGGPVWPAMPAASGVGPAPVPATTLAVDPLIGQIGTALFWVAVGWWTFVVIRILGYLTRHGLTDTILIRTIDLGAEETVVAAVLSVLAALLLLLGRGPAGRSPLGWTSAVIAVLTVAVAVWRVLP
jgi:hypothetical protein